MPLLKSLFCIKGHDNGRRFLLISVICYVFFILLSSVLAKAVILLILLLLVTTPVLLATSIRRIHDAGFATPLAGIPVAIYWLCVFVISYSDSGASWSLMILAVLATFGMTVVSNARVRHNHQYMLGYWGPVELNSSVDNSSTAPAFSQRIEPTIAVNQPEKLAPESPAPAKMAGSVENPAIDQTSIRPGYVNGSSSARSRPPIENKISGWFNANRRLSLIGAALISVLVVVIVLLSQSQPVVKPSDADVAATVEQSKQRLNKIELPDGFWIMLDSNGALTIAWQGDYKNDGQLWSAATAAGDNDCVEIRFSNQVKYRTIQVTVKNQGDYYADFSPIDTQKLVRAIGLLDQFKLCGYEFSLKGTQARLMNNKKYSSYFED